MSLSQVNNGDTGLEARTKVNAAIAAIPESPPGVAYLSTAGSDTTGDGSEAKPFLTLQKAFDAGFSTIFAGVGDFGSATYSGSSPLQIIGRGLDKTSFGSIQVPPGTTVRGNGQGMLYATALVCYGRNGDNGTEGPLGGNGTNGSVGDSAYMSVSDISLGSIYLKSGDGGAGGAGGPGDGGATTPGSGGNGADGQHGGILNLTRVTYSTVNCNGGNGGNGGDAGDLASGPNGGNGGNAGNGGTINAVNCIETTGHDTAPASYYGNGGAGTTPGVNGSPGANGTSNFKFCNNQSAGSNTSDYTVGTIVGGVFFAA